MEESSHIIKLENDFILKPIDFQLPSNNFQKIFYLNDKLICGINPNLTLNFLKLDYNDKGMARIANEIIFTFQDIREKIYGKRMSLLAHNQYFETCNQEILDIYMSGLGENLVVVKFLSDHPIILDIEKIEQSRVLHNFPNDYQIYPYSKTAILAHSERESKLIFYSLVSFRTKLLFKKSFSNIQSITLTNSGLIGIYERNKRDNILYLADPLKNKIISEKNIEEIKIRKIEYNPFNNQFYLYSLLKEWDESSEKKVSYFYVASLSLEENNFKQALKFTKLAFSSSGNDQDYKLIIMSDQIMALSTSSELVFFKNTNDSLYPFFRFIFSLSFRVSKLEPQRKVVATLNHHLKGFNFLFYEKSYEGMKDFHKLMLLSFDEQVEIINTDDILDSQSRSDLIKVYIPDSKELSRSNSESANYPVISSQKFLKRLERSITLDDIEAELISGIKWKRAYVDASINILRDTLCTRIEAFDVLQSGLGAVLTSNFELYLIDLQTKNFSKYFVCKIGGKDEKVKEIKLLNESQLVIAYIEENKYHLMMVNLMDSKREDWRIEEKEPIIQEITNYVFTDTQRIFIQFLHKDRKTHCIGEIDNKGKFDQDCWFQIGEEEKSKSNSQKFLTRIWDISNDIIGGILSWQESCICFIDTELRQAVSYHDFFEDYIQIYPHMKPKINEYQIEDGLRLHDELFVVSHSWNSIGALTIYNWKRDDTIITIRFEVLTIYGCLGDWIFIEGHPNNRAFTNFGYLNATEMLVRKENHQNFEFKTWKSFKPEFSKSCYKKINEKEILMYDQKYFVSSLMVFSKNESKLLDFIPE